MQGRLIFVTTCHFFGSMCRISFGWRNRKIKCLQSTTPNSGIPWYAGQGSEKKKSKVNESVPGCWQFFNSNKHLSKIKQYNLSVSTVRLSTLFTASEGWFYFNNNCYKWHIIFYSLVGQFILSCQSNVLDTLSLIP